MTHASRRRARIAVSILGLAVGALLVVAGPTLWQQLVYVEVNRTGVGGCASVQRVNYRNRITGDFQLRLQDSEQQVLFRHEMRGIYRTAVRQGDARGPRIYADRCRRDGSRLLEVEIEYRTRSGPRVLCLYDEQGRLLFTRAFSEPQ